MHLWVIMGVNIQAKGLGEKEESQRAIIVPG